MRNRAKPEVGRKSKKVSKSPMVIDVLNIQGIQRSLERLADLLAKIQKALGS